MPLRLRPLLLTALTVGAALVGSLAGSPARAQSAPAPRVLMAAPAEGIQIDGVLDEASWAAAEPATGFTQLRPAEGAPATQETDVRVLVGGDALYVGARLYDTEPDLIRRPLGRRDDPGQADLFLIALDAYNDRRTAYTFGVSAAGVLYDALLQGGDDDESWNAVWDGEARVTADGWVVEMRIPYSQLRFAEGVSSWGLNFVRHHRRNDEQGFWAPFTQSQANAGIVQFFGRLEGVGGVRPRRVMQAAPYALSRARRFESDAVPGEADAAYGFDAGADFKLGLASNVILDLAVNPDFGQVEADPAQLNLTTFETFFDERRPFFLEGTSIFNLPIGNGDGALLYTRRIGTEGRILGATKISGQTAGGLSFGALAALTGHDADPDRLYGVARVRRQFGGASFLGGGLSVFDYAPNDPLDSTAVEPAPRAVTGAADWDFRLFDDAWKLEGALAGSWRSVNGFDDRQGYALYVGFDRVQGYFTPGSGLRFYSPGFEPNDVGRFRQTDVIQARLGTGYIFNRGQPIGPFRQLNVGGFGTQTWGYSDGANRGFEFFGFGGGQFRNFHRLDFSTNVDGLGGVDVRETRGLGPIVNVPGFNFTIEYGTDQRRQLRYRTRS
ncbi:MAG TPA: DUF5916 domain-containing protein [Rhodothermales bacterium]|nr:DUF5916 domain-containing protein [Rhodothermales bacterium]